MAEPLKNDGATPEPPRDTGPPECMGKFRHYPQRVWVGKEMSDQVRCTTCGMTKTDGADIWSCDHKGDKYVILVEVPRGSDHPGNRKALRCMACSGILPLHEDLPLTQFDEKGLPISGVVQ